MITTSMLTLIVIPGTLILGIFFSLLFSCVTKASTRAREGVQGDVGSGESPQQRNGFEDKGIGSFPQDVEKQGYSAEVSRTESRGGQCAGSQWNRSSPSVYPQPIDTISTFPTDANPIAEYNSRNLRITRSLTVDVRGRTVLARMGSSTRRSSSSSSSFTSSPTQAKPVKMKTLKTKKIKKRYGTGEAEETLEDGVEYMSDASEVPGSGYSGPIDGLGSDHHHHHQRHHHRRRVSSSTSYSENPPSGSPSSPPSSPTTGHHCSPRSTMFEYSTDPRDEFLLPSSLHHPIPVRRSGNATAAETSYGGSLVPLASPSPLALPSLLITRESAFLGISFEQQSQYHSFQPHSYDSGFYNRSSSRLLATPPRAALHPIPSVSDLSLLEQLQTNDEQETATIGRRIDYSAAVSASSFNFSPTAYELSNPFDYYYRVPQQSHAANMAPQSPPLMTEPTYISPEMWIANRGSVGAQVRSTGDPRMNYLRADHAMGRYLRGMESNGSLIGEERSREQLTLANPDESQNNSVDSSREGSNSHGTESEQ